MNSILDGRLKTLKGVTQDNRKILIRLISFLKSILITDRLVRGGCLKEAGMNIWAVRLADRKQTLLFRASVIPKHVSLFPYAL